MKELHDLKSFCENKKNVLIKINVFLSYFLSGHFEAQHLSYLRIESDESFLKAEM
jgi:hypothetical protein